MVWASRTIPVVEVTGDPMALGLAVSLAHPGDNVTGIATLATEHGAKQLDLLHEILSSLHLSVRHIRQRRELRNRIVCGYRNAALFLSRG